MINKFTQKAQAALSAALTAAEELGHSYIGTEHLLLGLMAQRDSIAARILTTRGANDKKLRKAITEHIGIGYGSDIGSEDMTPRLHMIIENAAREAEKSGVRYVGTEHLLAALLDRRDCVAVRMLEVSGVTLTEIRADLCAYLGSTPVAVREGTARTEAQTKKDKKSVLLSYGKDLTRLAMEGKTDPVLCREKETERLIRILCRRSKNNPCLIGEPGVGKTAVVEGLAERIAHKRVPPELMDKRIITLDISSMIAGAKFRGEFEDRIKGVVEEVKSNPDIILFVDEMHIMVGAGAAEGAIDASNILKPSLSRGEIRMIGATTTAEYRAHIEKDAALERRFQPVRLEEPSPADTEAILKGLKERYEAHHGIKISDGAIEAAVRLSVRYIHDRFLPDKAIDLIDEAAAKLKLCSLPSCSPLYLADFEREKEEAVRSGDFERASLIAKEQRIAHRSASILTPAAPQLPTLTASDIAAVVSEQTSIPTDSMESSAEGTLIKLEEALSREIIGQDEAIRSVCSAIRRSKSGLCDPHRPIGSFLFLGNSGVGKTELCRVLANELFLQKDALIRFDMSEYMEKHSVSKLIGSPPGYVGYGEGGMLTERVRRHPYSVVLFDEIEKAHPDIFHILLQILDDGRLTDSCGRSVDFSSTVIIMTSNLISSQEAHYRSLGFSDMSEGRESNDLRSHKKLRELFKPEFLGRIDEIILFSPLGESELCKIARLLLERLCTTAKESGLSISADDSVSLLCAKKVLSLHGDMGARPLRRYIRELVESPLADLLMSSSHNRNSHISVSVLEGEVHFAFE